MVSLCRTPLLSLVFDLDVDDQFTKWNVCLLHERVYLMTGHYIIQYIYHSNVFMYIIYFYACACSTIVWSNCSVGNTMSVAH